MPTNIHKLLRPITFLSRNLHLLHSPLDSANSNPSPTRLISTPRGHHPPSILFLNILLHISSPIHPIPKHTPPHSKLNIPSPTQRIRSLQYPNHHQPPKPNPPPPKHAPPLLHTHTPRRPYDTFILAYPYRGLLGCGVSDLGSAQDTFQG